MDDEVQPTAWRRPPLGLSIPVCLLVAAAWVYGLLVAYSDAVIPFTYVLPLLICLWHRDRRLLWAMSLVFVAALYIKTYWVLPEHGWYAEYRTTVFVSRALSDGLATIVLDYLLRTLARLADRNRRYSELVRHAPAAIYEIDFRTRRFTSVNDAMCYMLGYSREELLATDPFDLIDEEGRARFQNRITKWLHGEQPERDVEYRIKTKDGRILDVVLDVTFTADESGKPLEATVVGHDVTDRKQAREALRQSEERFRLCTEALQGMVYDWDMVKDDLFRSRGLFDLIGYRPEEVPRNSQWLLDRVLPEDRFDVWRRFQKAVEARSPVFSSEYRVRHRDGRWVWVWDNGRLLFGEDGRAVRMTGNVLDITERKKAEEQLSRSQEMYRAIVEDQTEFVTRFLPTGEVVFMNEAILKYFNIKRENLIGRSFLPLVPEEERARLKTELAKLSRENPIMSLDHTVFDGKGGIRWHHWINRAIFDAEGRIVEIQGVGRDITERKLLEEQRDKLLDAERAARGEAEKLVRLKDEFLATVSHELRSPLSAIVGWTGLLARDKTDPDKAVEIIRRSASSLTRIVEDLLDMSRMISGKIRLKRERVDISELVHNAVHAVQFTARAKSIELEVSCGSEIAPLECDPDRVQQILWNLLTNALKFTPQGGKVYLAARQSQRYITVTVRDTGKGIAPEFLPYLFERFRQEDGSIARRQGGLGLGLSIVKHLVELHGGTITAHSKGEGRGATFVVRLPRPGVSRPERPAPSSVQHARSIMEGDECMLSGLRILGVDDDPYSCELLARILSEAGAVVWTAESAEAAHRMLDEFRPDVLISDLGMPGEDGFSFMRKIRCAADWRAELAAIAVTALGRPEDRESALEAGFDAHVSKPFDPGMLCTAVRDLVRAGRPQIAGLATDGHPTTPAGAGDEGRGKREEQTVTASASPVQPPATPAGRHILLAEDNATICEMLKGILEEHGYQVSTADTVAESFAIAAGTPVDILLSDLRLKDGSGWDLLKQLHSVRVIPGIVMSGYADDVYISRSKAAGFSEYLVKPVEADELIRVVEKLLAPSAAPRETLTP